MLLILVGVLLIGGSVGCVRRQLVIKTEPADAEVYLNDRLLGTSPVTYDFLWYGWYRVMVRKEGFERVQEKRLLRSPKHMWIPLDLVMELFPVKDERTWTYTLSPLGELSQPTPPETE